MVQLYQSCFAGVIPSSGWDSYRTSLEMMARPRVVGISIGDFRKLFWIAKRDYFAPGDPMELANCL